LKSLLWYTGVEVIGRMKKSRKTNWLLIALAAGMVILILAGLALLGAYLHLSRQTSVQVKWVGPVDSVQAGDVAPDLAVLTLAGEPDDRVIRAALDAGEVETAYATLAYSVLLPDTVRSGNWLLMASRYAERDPARTAICYAVVLDYAGLGPDLSDLARAELALQAGRGFAGQKQPEIARLALAEAAEIGRQSVTLLPAQRYDALVKVAAAYQSLGDSQAAKTLRAGLDAASAGPGVRLDPPPAYLPELRGQVVLPEAVAAAIIAREQAAAVMAGRWLAVPGEQDALAAAVGQALLAEDAARNVFYAAAGDLTDEDQLALLHDRIAWLTVKYRAARGDYGVALVSEWPVEEARAELARAYTDLINGYGRQLDILDPADASIARVELLRQGVLWARLGLFPDHAEELLSGQLLEAADALHARQGGVGLTVAVQEAAGRRFYVLSGAAR
jgi:hypothetical protein